MKGNLVPYNKEERQWNKKVEMSLNHDSFEQLVIRSYTSSYYQTPVILRSFLNS